MGLNYRRFGSGPVLVLQHGFLGGSGYFAPLMTTLGYTNDIVAPDLPGFAHSANEAVAESIEAYSRAQVELLDSLGIDKFSILGHSMGGMISLQTALDNPDRVEKLILYATASSGELPERFETFDKTLEKVKTQGVKKVAENVVASWFYRRQQDPMYPLCMETAEAATSDAVCASLKAFSQWNVTHRLSELDMPTLVIAGDKDRSYHLSGIIELARNIKHAFVCVLPQCAHCAHLEKPAVFSSIIQEFMIYKQDGNPAPG